MITQKIPGHVAENKPILTVVPNKITFTIYTSTDPLSKRYWLEDGVIRKEASAQMYKGTAVRVAMPMDELLDVLANAGAEQALGYGSHATHYPDQVNIFVAGKVNPEKNSISRTKDFYTYPDQAGLLMLDYDPSGVVMTADQLITELISFHPEIAHAARIVRGSVSAGVHKVGEPPRTDQGFHIYIPVKNAADIPRYGALLFDWLWLKGRGFIALSASGSLLVRTVIDGAVFSPERLDFVGKPIISGAGLEYTPPETTYVKGGLLDTATLHNFTEGSKATVEELKADAKAAIKSAADRKQAEWVSTKIDAMQAAGVPVDKAQANISQMLSGGCRDLYDDFLLEFATGTVSVADVLKNPAAFDGKSLADPVEGKTYGKTTAKFYANNDGKPVINSRAHGVDTRYFLHSTPENKSSKPKEGKAKKVPSSDPIGQAAHSSGTANWQVDLDNHVTQFNETHASVVVGGKHRIMRKINPDATHNKQGGYEFYTRHDLSLLHDNTMLKVGEKFLASGKVIDIFANHVMAWAKHPKARTYTGGVVFLPGCKVPADYFNTWQGFSVAPKQNNALLTPIYDHMKAVLCGGNQDLYDYLLKWTAYTFQNPDKQAGSTIVARGEKGSGKGTFGYFLSNIWGKHALQVNNTKHLIGNFNAHLADICFLFADEAFYSGDKQHEGVLKGLVTERTFMVERKGIDAIPQANFLKIYMGTNADFAVPASKDERRFCVLDVSSRHIKDRVYFNALYKACDSKEVQAAFLYAMLHVDLVGWHTGDIPDSVGLRAQRYHSLKTKGQWLASCLMKGTFGVCGAGGSGENWEKELTSDNLYRSYIAWCDKAKSGEYRREEECTVWRYLGSIYERVQRTKVEKKRGFYLGELETAIEQFEKYEKVKLKELTGYQDSDVKEHVE